MNITETKSMPLFIVAESIEIETSFSVEIKCLWKCLCPHQNYLCLEKKTDKK